MKSKIILFLLIIFVLHNTTQAQPGCGIKFNPFSLCGTDYQNSEYIFYGEVVSFEKKSYERKSEPKTMIKVVRVFKGKLQKKIELFVDSNQVFCGDLPIGSRYIFTANRANSKNQTAYYSRWWSKPITDYSKEGLKEVFARIHQTLDLKNGPKLQGYILEKVGYDTERISQMTEETKDRLKFTPDMYKTFPNVTVEARSELDGQIFKTKTDDTGRFVFTRLPLGIYQLNTIINGKEIRSETKVTNISCNGADIEVKSKSAKP